MTRLLRALRKRLSIFFFAPSDGRALAILRMVLGIGIAAEAILVFPYIVQLYGPFGYLQADLIEAITGRAIPGLLARAGLPSSAYGPLLTSFFLVHLSLALAVAVGFKTRAATIGLWLTQTIILNSGYYSSYGIDRYFQNLLFMMAFVPAARRWSVDAVREGHGDAARSDWTFLLRVMQLFVLATYADAGFSKTLGQDWWDGEAIWRVLNQPEFRRFDFHFLSFVPWIPVAAGWATMIVEGFYFGAAYTRVGAWWTAAIMGLHLGIAGMMGGLSLFGCTLAAVNAALFLAPRVIRGRSSAPSRPGRPRPWREPELRLLPEAISRRVRS